MSVYYMTFAEEKKTEARALMKRIEEAEFSEKLEALAPTERQKNTVQSQIRTLSEMGLSLAEIREMLGPYARLAHRLDFTRANEILYAHIHKRINISTFRKTGTTQSEAMVDAQREIFNENDWFLTSEKLPDRHLIKIRRGSGIKIVEWDGKNFLNYDGSILPVPAKWKYID